MNAKSRAAVSAQKKRRRNTYLISAVVVAFVIGMIYYEQVALLYVLSTFSIVALLIVVAWSDMGEAKRPAGEPPPLDDAASVGSGITAAATATQARPRPSARAARGRR